jgi:hypothetical protein
MVQLKEGMRAICRRGWSPSRSDVDQSAGEKGGAVLPKAKKRRPEAVARAGQTMQLSAGNGGGAVSPKAKKRRRNAVARAAGFHPRERVNEGKRDS